MPSINVSLKDGADKDQLEQAKKQVHEQGGKVTHEFTLIKGFTAEFPDDKQFTLSTNEHINVEADKERRPEGKRNLLKAFAEKKQNMPIVAPFE